jgi:hypothetical protein
VIAGAYKWFIRPGPGSKDALIEAIDKREPGSVDALIEALDKFGGQTMAEDLLTCCKNPKIEQAVVAWAPRHGLVVRSVR